jgi:methylmalonyl-CoA mutase N-terminal domain/subunit
MATRPTDRKAPTDAEEAAKADEATERAVEEDLHRYVAPVVGPDDERVFTDSGIEIDRLYDESDVAPGLEERLGEPGAYPFTRGIHDGMYRDRLWTMRQYAGFSSPEDTNGRYRYLLEHGSTGLSMAFDLPTSSVGTPTTRSVTARSAAPGCRSTRSRTCGSASTRSRSTRSRPR